MNRKLLIIACVIAAAVLVLWAIVAHLGTYTATVADNGMPTIHVDGQTIRVTIANTEAARELGLSGRAGLAADEGMLFVFPTSGKYAFWMKDMKFSIDMVWINAQGKIVYIAANVAPATYPKDFVSTAPARYVLELPANYTAKHSIKVGDTVQL